MFEVIEQVKQRIDASVENGHYQLEGEDVAQYPLVTLQEINEGSFFSKIMDYIKLSEIVLPKGFVIYYIRGDGNLLYKGKLMVESTY